MQMEKTVIVSNFGWQSVEGGEVGAAEERGERRPKGGEERGRGEGSAWNNSGWQLETAKGQEKKGWVEEAGN